MQETKEIVISVLRWDRRLSEFIVRIITIWEKPLPAALLTGIIVICLSIWIRVPWRVTGFSYYNYLADAFLHGQLALRLIPPNSIDLTYYQGNYYLYWGPLPGILLMPFIALFGVGLSDTMQSILIGSLNVGLFALLLQQVDKQSITKLNRLQRGFLILFFALGTAQVPLLALGSVWHIAQLVAICFSLLAYLAAFSFEREKAFFWTGIAVACILATRNSMVFVSIFLAWYLLHRHWRAGFGQVIKYCLIGALPVAFTGLLLLAYNAARFENPLENGLAYHLMSPMFRAPFEEYGMLNVHYIPINLYLNLLFYPFTCLFPLEMVPMGGSLLLLSPLFFAAVSAVWIGRRKWITWLLLLTILIGSAPSLTVMAPGSVTFGPRYLLDIAPPLLLLTAIGIRRWPMPLVVVCTAVSVVHYLLGTILMLKSWF